MTWPSPLGHERRTRRGALDERTGASVPRRRATKPSLARRRASPEPRPEPGLSVSGAMPRVQHGGEQLKRLFSECCAFEFECCRRVNEGEPGAKDEDSECGEDSLRVAWLGGRALPAFWGRPCHPWRSHRRGASFHSQLAFRQRLLRHFRKRLGGGSSLRAAQPEQADAATRFRVGERQGGESLVTLAKS